MREPRPSAAPTRGPNKHEPVQEGTPIRRSPACYHLGTEAPLFLRKTFDAAGGDRFGLVQALCWQDAGRGFAELCLEGVV